ncbi:MAG: hypothetical protein H6715_05410 [Myxococcales bacterium]|nr:hypothetical protein [Myxococcales bacterium]
MDLDDSLIEAKLNAAEVLIHPLHDFDEAIELANDALDIARESDEIAEAMLLKIDALLHRGDAEHASRVAGGLPIGPFERAGLDFMVGRAKFEVGDLIGAEPLLRAAFEREKNNGDVLYVWGLFLRAQQKTQESLIWLLAAREADQRTPSWPWSLEPGAFRTRVDAALARLEESARAKIVDVAVIVADLPGAEVVTGGVDPRAGVHWDGCQDEPSESQSPSFLFVYQRNIERIAHGGGDVEDEILHCLEHLLASDSEPPSDLPQLPVASVLV